MKEKQKKAYKIINVHPIYKNEEEKIEAYKKAALALALEAKYLKELYPDENF